MQTDDILQHCLEELAAGRMTAQECAALYPQVPDLLEQLQAAQTLRTGRPLTVSPAAAQRHQAQLRAALAANRARARRPALWSRWAIAAALVAVVVLGGAGTVRAADSSLPGHSLYPVKRAAEAVQGVFVPAAAQAAWHTHLAEARTAELAAIAADPTTSLAQLEQTAGEIGGETLAALAHIAQAPAAEHTVLLETLLNQIDTQLTVLLTVRAQLPAEAQAGLGLALTASRLNQASAQAQLDALEQAPNSATQRPPTHTPRASNVPPGQATQTTTAQAPTDTATPAATATPPGNSGEHGTPATPPGSSGEQGTPTTPPGNSGGPGTPATPPGNSGGQGTPATPPGNSGGQGTPATPPGNSGGQGTPAEPTTTPPGNSGGQGTPAAPNCHANNPNSPNYCTPTPAPPDGGGGDDGQAAATDPPAAEPSPTACPLNPAGKPVCSQQP